MPHRLHPPRVDAGEKVRMGDKMRQHRMLADGTSFLADKAATAVAR
jgi:hypothetical protein